MKFCVSNISAFIEAIKSRDKGYFEAFIRAYEPVLQSRAERFVSHYNLSAGDTEDIKQILSLSLGVCFDCFGIFKPGTYAEIALKQGASGEKSIEKKRKAAIEKFAKELCDMGFCDGVFLKQTAITVIKEKDKKIVQSAAYAYTPYGDGKAGEILYTAAGKYRFQIVRLAEFDVTGAYAEQVARIIDNMNGNFIKERFYAIPLENLPRINSHNKNPRLPFYHQPHTGRQR